MVRYGVFGGTFDPPHYGHLALAETARVQLGLARVLFVPAGRPPHKARRALSPVVHRVAMVEAAIADNEGFALSRVDVDRPGPHFTVETLALLREAHPQVEGWYFLMGEDSLRDFSHWYRPQEIVTQSVLAVMPRGEGGPALEAWQARYPFLRGRCVGLDVPPIHLAATALRRRVRLGLPLRYLVPPAVEAYIVRHRLYV